MEPISHLMQPGISYNCSPNCFGLVSDLIASNNIRWYYCREQFHTAFNRRKDSSLFFNFDRRMSYHAGKYDVMPSSLNIEHLQEFISHIEDKIKLAKSRRCKIEPTDVPGIAYVDMGMFWYALLMRRSLFTIFLRCGLQCCKNNNNFEAALWSRHYTQNTKLAIEKFLKGYTVYNGQIKRGWCSVFTNLTKINDRVKIGKLLTKE